MTFSFRFIRHTHTHTLVPCSSSRFPSLLLVPEPDQSLSLSLRIQHYSHSFIYLFPHSYLIKSLEENVLKGFSCYGQQWGRSPHLIFPREEPWLWSLTLRKVRSMNMKLLQRSIDPRWIPAGRAIVADWVLSKSPQLWSCCLKNSDYESLRWWTALIRMTDVVYTLVLIECFHKNIYTTVF